MLALVMAGGRGTRLRPLSDVIPKPLLPVRDRPVLEWILFWLEAAGVEETVVVAGYLSERIQAYLAARPRSSMRVRCYVEEEPLGTAGAIGRLHPLTDPFLVVNGDVLTTASIRDLLAAHQAKGAMITLGTRRLCYRVQSGVLRQGPAGVVAYDEKPTISWEIAAGVYVLGARVQDFTPVGAFDMPALVMAALARGCSVQTHELEGYWMDIGVPEQYAAGARDFPGL